MDNVKGINGIGKQGAKKLVQKHGALEGIYTAMPTLVRALLRNCCHSRWTICPAPP